jgi:hypothetical protein
VPKNRREYVERELRLVNAERERFARDVERLAAGLMSDSEKERFRALRGSCPCRVPWEVFGRVRAEASGLREDPSHRVRDAAGHLESDARKVEALEDAAERFRQRDRATEKEARRRRSRRVRYRRWVATR